MSSWWSSPHIAHVFSCSCSHWSHASDRPHDSDKSIVSLVGHGMSSLWSVWHCWHRSFSSASTDMGCANSAACTSLFLQPALSFIMNHSADAARFGWTLCLLVSYRSAIRARRAKGAMLAGMTGLGAQGACCGWTVPFIMAIGAADGAELGFEQDFGGQWFALA